MTRHYRSFQRKLESSFHLANQFGSAAPVWGGPTDAVLALRKDLGHLITLLYQSYKKPAGKGPAG